MSQKWNCHLLFSRTNKISWERMIAATNGSADELEGSINSDQSWGGQMWVQKSSCILHTWTLPLLCIWDIGAYLLRGKSFISVFDFLHSIQIGSQGSAVSLVYGWLMNYTYLMNYGIFIEQFIVCLYKVKNHL